MATRPAVPWWASLALVTISCTDAAPDGPLAVPGHQPVVYGQDDRDDIYAHDDPVWADSVAGFTIALVSTPGRIDAADPNDVRLNAPTLAELGVCADERFAAQLVAADCSGKLIAPDLVLTAGHCVTNSSDCAATQLLFNYYMTSATTRQTITAEDVYTCAELVVHRLDAQLDYAVLRLDRPVSRRTPAMMTTARERLPAGTGLILSGFPSGLPIKIDDGGGVRDPGSQDLTFFRANLDSFGGNSGSGVFDATTRALVGILVRGEIDYVLDEQAGCGRVNVCPNDGCRGEAVVYAVRAVEALCETAPDPGLCDGCGDNVCAGSAGESTVSCPFDCGTDCGDTACNGTESPVTCPQDCGTCGNAVCDGSESSATCCVDCGCGGGLDCIDNVCFDTGGNTCADARIIDALSLQVVEGNTLVTGDVYAPTAACAVGSSGGGRDVAYRLTLPAAARVTASVAGSFDTVLYMRSNCDDARSEVACNDDVARGVVSSEVDVAVPAGTYFLVVDGYSADAAGVYELRVAVDYEGAIGLPGGGDNLDSDGGCVCLARVPSPGPPSLGLVLLGGIAWAGWRRRLRSRGKCPPTCV